MMMMMMMFIMIIYSSSCERRNWNEIIKKKLLTHETSESFLLLILLPLSSWFIVVHNVLTCYSRYFPLGWVQDVLKYFTMKCFNLVLLQCKILVSQFLFFLPAFWLKVAHRNEHDSPKSMKWFQWNYFLLTIFASVLYMSNYWGSFKFLLQISKANKSRS